MSTISLCMIVKNEEDVLARCLNSIKDIVDEIIIVDTGSTDHTKIIAKEFTTNIFNFEWIQDFSAARNFAFSKASKDFILWLDADDVLLEENHKDFLKLKEELNHEIDTVMLKYNVGFDDEGNVTLSFYRERLVRRAKNFKWVEPVHEYIQTSGNTILRDIPITHRKMHAAASDRNLAIYEAMQLKGKLFSTRGLYYFAKELFDHQKYVEAIHKYQKFLDRSDGWVEDKINACYSLSTCYQLTNQKDKILQILYHTFEYDTPRAEICCSIGNYYVELQQYKQAIFWYQLAANLEKPEENRGFILHDYWGFLPNIQLCICYDRLGKHKEAMEYNEKAAEYKPNSPAVIYNRNYFSKIMKELEI